MRERIVYIRMYTAEDLGDGSGPLAARSSPRLDMTESAASMDVRTRRRWADEILKDLKPAGGRHWTDRTLLSNPVSQPAKVSERTASLS